MSERVHELAKDLKLTSKEVLDKLKALKITAKNHMSVLTAEDIKKFKSSLSAKSKATPSGKTAAKPASIVPEKPAAASVKPAVVPMSSLASVKNELFTRKQEMKAAQAAPTHKPISRSEPRKDTSSFVSRTGISTPPRPRETPPGVKKIFKPSPIAEAPAHSSAPRTAVPAEPPKPKKLEVETPITVKDLSEKMFIRSSELIQKLIKNGVFANINQSINFEMAKKVALEFNYELTEPKQETGSTATEQIRVPKDTKGLVFRAPIVTFMGHVDHGKTSLLDAIRKTKVTASEAGGITQHIGAYEVFLPNGAVTFLDTPGHEAFTAMRARGASVTDVVVLVVAADDGVMPQTIEAIDHAKAAGVPIVVAINKIDLPSANPERVKKALMEHNLLSEEWGGKTTMKGVSAKTGQGIDELLELLVLESDLLELRANPLVPAKGVVVEAALSKGSGVLATVLIQDGTLRVGDITIVGNSYCKVRAMINDRGQRIKEALPSMPVEILGLDAVPRAGDIFYVVKDEKTAKEIIEKKQQQERERTGPAVTHMTLEHLYEGIKAGKVEELKLIIKSDVQGSIEALRATLAKIQSKNVRLNTIHAGIGDVTESDVMLAAASDAVLIGFHVSIVGAAREIAEREGVDIHFYEIIYEAKTAIEKAMEGLLQPEIKELFLGMAEVRQVFKVSKAGTIAGCSVQKGKIIRNAACRILRAGAKIHEGKVVSLKRFKDDAREVLEGFECGIGVTNFDEYLVADRIEVFEQQKIARKLE